MSVARIVLVGGVLLLLAPWLAVGQSDDLAARIDRLIREGRYDLALDLLDDHEERGQTLSPELLWRRARLVADPDRFDRLGLELWNGLPAGDQMRARITLERAREHFARGRYETAAEYLRGLPSNTHARLPEIPLFLGMASQALGETRNATQAFESVPSRTPEHAIAQALLAELALREGRIDRAESYAGAALDLASEDLGAQALLVLVRVAEQRGDEEAAAGFRSRLRREFPRSAEAIWIRESAATAGDESASGSARFSEEEAPLQRREFALQFGAFHDRSLALKMAGELAGDVEHLRIELDRSAEPPWYRVVGGRFVTRSQADAARTRLRSDGIDSVVLAPGRGGR